MSEACLMFGMQTSQQFHVMMAKVSFTWLAENQCIITLLPKSYSSIFSSHFF